jgi:predicted transposase YbfD/YdcC
LQKFDVTSEQVCFPNVKQAARLTRFVDRKDAKKDEIELEWLLSSISMQTEYMLKADRDYWGIENGLHLRLDVTGGEDRSRVRNPVSALNLAMIRRATTSLAIHWIQRCRNKRQATLRGFYDFMTANNARKAFSLVTVSKSAWLPP